MGSRPAGKGTVNTTRRPIETPRETAATGARANIVAGNAATPAATRDMATLRSDTLRAATADALGVAGASVCSDIAFLSATRDRSVQSTIVRWRGGWTAQMSSVLRGGAMPARPDGPRWYTEMMAQVGGQPAAQQMLAYVLEQMPSSIVGLCSDIRRQSERE